MTGQILPNELLSIIAGYIFSDQPIMITSMCRVNKYFNHTINEKKHYIRSNLLRSISGDNSLTPVTVVDIVTALTPTKSNVLTYNHTEHKYFCKDFPMHIEFVYSHVSLFGGMAIVSLLTIQIDKFIAYPTQTKCNDLSSREQIIAFLRFTMYEIYKLLYTQYY